MSPIQILLNSTQFITSGTESNLEGFVWRNQSKTGLESPKTICPTMLVFSQKGLSDVVLSKCPNKSHNFQKFLEHYGAKMLVVNKSGLYRLNLWLVRKLARYFPSRRSTHQNYTKAITKHAVAIVVWWYCGPCHQIQDTITNLPFDPIGTSRNDNVDVPEVKKKNTNRKLRFSLFQCSN